VTALETGELVVLTEVGVVVETTDVEVSEEDDDMIEALVDVGVADVVETEVDVCDDDVVDVLPPVLKFALF